MATSNSVWYNNRIAERGIIMNKRILILSALALTLLMVLCGCSGGTNFPTDLGTFKVIHATTMDTYSTMNAQTGQTLLVVRMTMDLGFDETRFKNYFAAEDESSVAKATIGGGEYNCTAVAYQGLASEDKVEYVLVFAVAKSATEDMTEFQLAAPNQQPVSIKLSAQ